MSLRPLLRLTLLLAFAAPSAAGAQAVATAPAEARQRVGTTVTVCGTIAGAQYVSRGSRLTILTFASDTPEQDFAAVMTASARAQMRVPPEEQFLNKQVCVKGLVTVVQEAPVIIVAGLNQIWLRR